MHWRESPRYISQEDAGTLAELLPDSIQPVGLFVDADSALMEQSPFSWIQLHGNEDEAACERVKSTGRTVIRGFRFSEEAVRRWSDCEAVDYLLVDGSPVGGEGIGFDHARLEDVTSELEKPLILAGGLDPDNVAEAIRATSPWGVDVSSGVERTRGEKDPARIIAFCRAAGST